MRIGVTSENALKLTAVDDIYSAYVADAEVRGYATNSLIGEQPINDDTLRGAINRISDLRGRVHGLDRIVSIESGIFRESEGWIDRAVVVVLDPHTGRQLVGYSEGVQFPDMYVQTAMNAGFEKITVGQVMADAGYIVNPKDPHASITGISRKQYILDTLRNAVSEFEGRA